MVPLIPCRCAPVAAGGRRQALQLPPCIVAAPQTLTASRSVAMASGDGGSDEQPKVGRCVSCLYDFALASQGSHPSTACVEFIQVPPRGVPRMSNAVRVMQADAQTLWSHRASGPRTLRPLFPQDFHYTHLWVDQDGETHLKECSMKGFDLKSFAKVSATQCRLQQRG